MRIAIVVNSGSGKSTLARQLAEIHSLPILDLDTVAWEPGRVAVLRSPAKATDELNAFLDAHDRWVVEGCYGNLTRVALVRISGEDKVALESDGSELPFLLRGAEGNYAQWLKESGGPYHGLLLSTANCFPRELKEIIVLLENENIEEAVKLSDKLSLVIEQVFGLVEANSGRSMYA